MTTITNNWTREDLPAMADVLCYVTTRELGEGATAYLEAALAHLNAHHPKPATGLLSSAADLVLGSADRVRVAEDDAARWRRAHAIVEAERDQARSERDELQAKLDSLRVAYSNLDARANKMVERVAAAERERDECQARAEAAEARTAPAVTKADIEECIYGSRRAGRECDEQGFVPVHIQEAVEELRDLHKGDDPAVLVVRESGIAAIKVEQDSHGEWFADGEHVYVDDARQADHLANEYMTKAVRRFAVARAIEQDAAADPLLGKAQEFAALADWELTDREAELLHTVAAHVLGQEADNV